MLDPGKTKTRLETYSGTGSRQSLILIHNSFNPRNSKPSSSQITLFSDQSFYVKSHSYNKWGNRISSTEPRKNIYAPVALKFTQLASSVVVKVERLHSRLSSHDIQAKPTDSDLKLVCSELPNIEAKQTCLK